jgi:tetratricopeptide (TPR) repeat protein
LGARLLAARGEMRRAAQKLEDAALRVEESDPRRAALMLVDAAQYWNEVGEDARSTSASERAWKLPWPRGGATEVTLALMYGDFLAAQGRLAEARKLWLSIADVPADGDPETLTRIADAVVAAGQDEQARVAAERAVERARECSALAVLPVALGVLALAQVRIGRLRSAAASAGEAVELSRALGQRGEQQERLARLAWVEGLLGRELESRRHAAEVGEMLDAIGYDGTVGGSGLGALELSLGNPREAIEAFEATLRVRKGRIRGDALSTRPVLADLVEAYVRAGRVDDARRIAAFHSPWQLRLGHVAWWKARSVTSSMRSPGTSGSPIHSSVAEPSFATASFFAGRSGARKHGCGSTPR